MELVFVVKTFALFWRLSTRILCKWIVLALASLADASWSQQYASDHESLSAIVSRLNKLENARPHVRSGKRKELKKSRLYAC